MATSPGPATTRSGGAAGRPVLGGASAATDALAGAGSERVWALTDGEVAEAVRALGALAVAVDAHLVTVLAEAKRRSLGAGAGWGPVDWARAMAPGLSTRDLADLDIVAGVAAGGEPRLADVLSAVADGADGADGAVAGPQAQQALPVGKAAQLVRFHRSVAGLADPAQLDEVTAVLLDAARGPGALDERHLAAAIRHTGTLLRPDRLVEHDTALRRAHRSLVKGRGPVGLARYTVLLDEEGAAILDTAVDALAKPVPDEAGERDPRTPAARRADALLDLVTRAVAAPDGVARQAKTTLVVTMDLAALQQRCRGAGRTPAGEVLTPATVRRLACDCQVVPMVLGTHGEILDQGRARRLFDRAQVRHLWVRDRHCTFPGCSRPPAWTDAHHLIHWADHGPTTIDNAALLCRAHHTVVHQHAYAGRVVHDHDRARVVWDLTPGSYATALSQQQAARTPVRPNDDHHGPPPP